MAKKGTGFLGWLGRQVGYVKKAVSTDVTQQIVHREEKVEKAKLPDKPNVTLRRTVIDEVIVKKKGTHYIAVNADESEPGTFKDRYLMDYDPHQMLEGIAIASIATQCDVAYVFIRGEFHREAKVLQRAIEEAYAKKVFGKQGIFGSNIKVECHMHRGAGAYICGEETGL